MSSEHTVVVLGASKNPERFSNQAICLLHQHQYCVLPVHPTLKHVCELHCYNTLEEITTPVINTLTLYLSPEKLNQLRDKIIALNPGRVIFNPGTESEYLQNALNQSGIPWQHDCTLVMLRNNRF